MSYLLQSSNWLLNKTVMEHSEKFCFKCTLLGIDFHTIKCANFNTKFDESGHMLAYVTKITINISIFSHASLQLILPWHLVTTDVFLLLIRSSFSRILFK